MQRQALSNCWAENIYIFPAMEYLDLSDLAVPQARSLPKDYNAFYRSLEDGTRVKCFTGKIEMGQGAITALPQMMADELNVQLEKIK